MNLIALDNLPENLYLSEQRKNQRHAATRLLAITERGTGQILDISREGLSFGCLYPHTFPHAFCLDILNANGTHIKKLHVRKIWETIGNQDDPDTEFELVVGMEISELTTAQADKLDYLLEGMEQIDSSYRAIL